MKDEIKEILAEIKDSINETPKRMFKYNKITFNLEESQVLLDYITNLQEENERLKEWKKDLLDENIDLENIRKEAIEYIGNGNLGIPRKTRDKFIAILKGEDKDVKNKK